MLSSNTKNLLSKSISFNKNSNLYFKSSRRFFSNNWTNFLCYNETQKNLREMVQKFSKAEIQPIAKQIDKTDEFPRHLFPKMGELGLLGMTIPSEYGGSDMGYFEHCLVLEEISRYSASVGLSYGAHSNLCVNQISRHGNEYQKKKYLPKLCSGEFVGALAMSER